MASSVEIQVEPQTGGWNDVTNMIIRPPRFVYPVQLLGPKVIKAGGIAMRRTDFEVKNSRGHTIVGSEWSPVQIGKDGKAVSAEGLYRSALGAIADAGPAAATPGVEWQHVRTLEWYAELLADWEQRERDADTQAAAAREIRSRLAAAAPLHGAGGGLMVEVPLSMRLAQPR